MASKLPSVALSNKEAVFASSFPPSTLGTIDSTND